MATDKKSTLTRMVLPEHECPFGVRAKALLDDAGISYKEHILKTREEVEAYKAKHGVQTTPQVVLDGRHIGGSDALEEYLAKSE